MKKLEKIRQALADYMASEGCDCCQNKERHEEAHQRLAELLEAQPDKDGYRSFWPYRSGHNGGASRDA